MEQLIYTSKVVEDYYRCSDNIKIEYCNSESDIHLVCFSDNGVFYPWTEEQFKKIIIEKDRYQWVNITKEDKIRKKYKSIIYIRDIFQSWYIRGISNENNSPQKVADTIRKLTGGGKIVTIGSSAGGYYAVLIGVLLNAVRIFSFSGQFIIDNEYESNPMVKSATDEQRAYYDLKSYVDKYTGHIFYFCPYNCVRDRIQLEHIAGTPALYDFKCKSAMHGQTIIPQTMQYFLFIEDEKIVEIYEKYRKKIINEKLMLMQTSGIRLGLIVLLKRFIQKKIKNKHKG